MAPSFRSFVLLVLRYSFLPLTVLANAPKLQLMIRNGETGSFCDALIDLGVDRLVQVKNPAAFFTSEMIVVFLIAFIPADGAAEVEFRDFPVLSQYPEVTVDRTLTDIRYHFSDFVIDPIGRRMGIGMPEHVQDGPSLPGLSSYHS
jgi:hypothetical protein